MIGAEAKGLAFLPGDIVKLDDSLGWSPEMVVTGIGVKMTLARDDESVRYTAECSWRDDSGRLLRSTLGFPQLTLVRRADAPGAAP